MERLRCISHLCWLVFRLAMRLLLKHQRLRPEKSEVERLWAANDNAKELLGCSTQYGGLERFRKGLFESVVWIKIRQT